MLQCIGNSQGAVTWQPRSVMLSLQHLVLSQLWKALCVDQTCCIIRLAWRTTLPVDKGSFIRRQHSLPCTYLTSTITMLPRSAAKIISCGDTIFTCRARTQVCSAPDWVALLEPVALPLGLRALQLYNLQITCAEPAVDSKTNCVA
jgi:hypothetical protein